MAFEDRVEAGQPLARRLANYRGRHPLVLAIPRGAVPMGKILTDALDGQPGCRAHAQASRAPESGTGDRIDR